MARNAEPEEPDEPEESDEFGLPRPKKYEGPYFDVRDYLSDTYAEAESLEEAIEMRGADAFAQEVDPADFLEEDPDETRLGIAELWAESTWHGGDSPRDVKRERAVAAIREGDLLEVQRRPTGQSGWGYVFALPDGTVLPYTPFHDYDDQFFRRALNGCLAGDRLVCRVRSVVCHGGDHDVPVDPGFCWRVYSCKVTVSRRR